MLLFKKGEQQTIDKDIDYLMRRNITLEKDANYDRNYENKPHWNEE